MTNHLSASSIQAFEKCPTAFRLGYVELLRPAEDADVLRVGTNWHQLFEVHANTDGTPEAKMQAVVDHLDAKYADVPSFKNAEEWALERQVLLTSFIGYQWYFQNDPYQVIASEVPFDLPVHEPKTGMPCSLQSVIRKGKIDHLAAWRGAVCVWERKSTSKSLDPDSDYWTQWNKNVQASMYSLALKDMESAGLLSGYHIADKVRFGNTVVDAWRKPTIKPAMLTQAETKALYDTRMYAGQGFCPEYYNWDQVAGGAGGDEVSISGYDAEVKRGAKGFAIRETVPMFGARLLADIYENPTRYYARREIVRTDAEVREFRNELFNIYRAMELYKERGIWWHNRAACDTPYRCQFRSICNGVGSHSVCDGATVPNGFKRIHSLPVVEAAPEE